MRETIARALDNERLVYGACLVTLALGLIFTFVWAPHPWDWRGIDQYHNLAQALARGEPFGTTDVPWGYAYYVAAFYTVFGPHAWIPVTAQVVINAFAPLILYKLVRPLTNQRIAVLSAVLTGLFSFNTVYASTQASDAVCMVLFISMLLCFSRAGASSRLSLFAVAGAIAGLVPQFRPNMILFPPILALSYLVVRLDIRRKLPQVAIFLLTFALALVPWTVRNYELTGMFMPTSTHGGIQLWYGTLQTGDYVESRAYNPRSVFESPTFPYTSITDQPLVITARLREAAPETGTRVRLHYRSDRDPTPRESAPQSFSERVYVFNIPPQASPTVLYFYFTADWPGNDENDGGRQIIPANAKDDPFLYFVDDHHLGDMDRHGDLVDAFDIARMVQHVQWDAPLSHTTKLDLAQDGRIDRRDIARAIAALVAPSPRDESILADISGNDTAVTVMLSDGSMLTVPRTPVHKITDIEFAGNHAAALAYTRRSFKDIERELATPPGYRPPPCCVVGDVEVNEVFYRKEPHMMQRYLALAADNISRDPWGFLAASAYRLFRLFVIRGTDDRWTAHQFRFSTVVYGLGTALSAANLVAFLAGVWIAWRRRYAVLPLGLAVAYVPLTICFVLTNMRYTITVQPFMFVFVAIAVLWALKIGTEAQRA